MFQVPAKKIILSTESPATRHNRWGETSHRTFLQFDTLALRVIRVPRQNLEFKISFQVSEGIFIFVQHYDHGGSLQLHGI